MAPVPSQTRILKDKYLAGCKALMAILGKVIDEHKLLSSVSKEIIVQAHKNFFDETIREHQTNGNGSLDSILDEW
jgi:hypothetical protein